MLVALGAAGLGARLLSPPTRTPPPVEVDLRAHFSEEEIERGKRFARPQLALALSRGLIQLATLALIARGPAGGFGPQRRKGRRPLRRRAQAASPAVGGAVAGAALAVVSGLPALPLAAVARRRAVTVGLVTQSWGGWAVDLVKSAAIEAAMASGAGAAMVALTRRYPREWWLPAAAGSVVVGAGLAALSPILLDPVFNDFTPLAEGPTRDDVLELARAAGVRVGEVYSVDASRRTTAANGYVTGLGPTKRVVLFDTLLDRYNRQEVKVVVAHELAHVLGRDVWRSVLYAAIVAPAAARAVQRLSGVLSGEQGTPASLPGLALSAALAAAPLGLFGNSLSRAVERRADAWSLELSQSPDAFVSFERSIALQNVADLDPPRWVSRLLATHPPTAERIGAALSFARQREGG